MHMSRASGQPEWCPDGGKTDTIAEGLAPPFAGRAAFKHIEEFVDDLVLVTDDEMREVRKRSFSSPFSILKMIIYQDRLGTNIGKALKKDYFLR